MFNIEQNEKGDILLSGRFDATQEEKAKEVFGEINETCTVDFTDLSYISSAGLGILLGTQKRLIDSGKGLILKNLNNHIMVVFKYAGFDQFFKIE